MANSNLGNGKFAARDFARDSRRDAPRIVVQKVFGRDVAVGPDPVDQLVQLLCLTCPAMAHPGYPVIGPVTDEVTTFGASFDGYASRVRQWISKVRSPHCGTAKAETPVRN
jgi:hypothetical protein